MHVRINLKFIKEQVAPLIQNYRADLFNFCHERAHPFDFFRELLNIYFEKPTNNMKFGLLDIRKDALACLEPLREQFEIHYNEPQKTRSDARQPVAVRTPEVVPVTSIPRKEYQVQEPTLSGSPSNPISGESNPDESNALPGRTIIPAAPYHAVPPPPDPVWNDVKGIWEYPTPPPVQSTPPPPPQMAFNPATNQWEPIGVAAPVTVAPLPVIEAPSAEDAAAFLANLPANQPVVEEIDTINESHDPPPTTIKMRDVTFDPNMFIPLKTNTILDDYMSLTGGIMPATNVMVQGPAGSGKSSVLIDIGCKMMEADKKKRILFLSGEMTRIDMKGLNDRFDGFENLDILFLNEYTDTDTRILLETILSTGWDMVIVDSFSEVLGSIIDTAHGTSINTKSGEKWLINQFLKHNEGGNDRNLPTMFFFILQVGKDGNFVGSNRIKHAATAFMNIEFTKNRNLYIYFSKNRRGETHNNLYFEHHAQGIHFDFKRYKEDIAIREALKRSEVANKEAWGKLLDENNDDSKTKITVKAVADTTDADRSESLLGSITSYDTTGPGAPEEDQEEEEDPNVVPIMDRRTAHLTRQITLDESIEEVEAETTEEIAQDEVEKVIEEVLDEVVLEEEKVDVIFDPESTDNDSMDEALAEQQAVEEEVMNDVEIDVPVIIEDIEVDVPIKEESVIAETVTITEEEKTDSPFKGIDLHDDVEEEVSEKEDIKEEKEEEIVEKSIPKDNPNSHDFTNLVEL